MAGRKKAPQEDESGYDLHDESLLMVPPPGFKFIPKSELVCGKPGCFECFDIYCERCESKERRIVELEMRNNDLVKYVTQLQGRIFGSGADPTSIGGQLGATPTGANVRGAPDNPFAFVQSPVLYDPNLNINYIATTSFSPAPKEHAARIPAKMPPKP